MQRRVCVCVCVCVYAEKGECVCGRYLFSGVCVRVCGMWVFASLTATIIPSSPDQESSEKHIESLRPPAGAGAPPPRCPAHHPEARGRPVLQGPAS